MKYLYIYFYIKGTKRHFQVTLLPTIAMPDSQRHPSNFYLIKNVEDIVVFLGITVFNSDHSYKFSCSRNAQVTFVKNNQFSKL